MTKESHTVCRIGGCDRLVSQEGYCRPHYLSHSLKLDPKRAQRVGIPLGRLGEQALRMVVARPHRYAPLVLPDLDERLPAPLIRSLTAHQLRELERHGPHPKRTCRRCDYPEARDGLCRHHWLTINVGHKLRRDIAQKIGVERLTLDKIADIRDLPVRSSWLRIEEIADSPYLPEPLETEQRRHNLRRAYRSGTTLTLAAMFSWPTRRISNRVPPEFTATPRLGASTGELVTMSIGPSIAEALYLGHSLQRSETLLWDAIDHQDSYWPARRQDLEAISAIREAFPTASANDLLKLYRRHEVQAANLLSEAATWQRIVSLAEALIWPA